MIFWVDWSLSQIGGGTMELGQTCVQESWWRDFFSFFLSSWRRDWEGSLCSRGSGQLGNYRVHIKHKPLHRKWTRDKFSRLSEAGASDRFGWTRWHYDDDGKPKEGDISVSCIQEWLSAVVWTDNKVSFKWIFMTPNVDKDKQYCCGGKKGKSSNFICSSSYLSSSNHPHALF